MQTIRSVYAGPAANVNATVAVAHMVKAIPEDVFNDVKTYVHRKASQ